MRNLNSLFLIISYCVTICIFAGPVHADENGFAISGIGAADCATYNAKINPDKGATDIFLDWSQGFLSGINTGEFRSGKRNAFLTIPDRKLIKTFVDGYCKEFPEKTIFRAVTDLFDIHAEKQKTK